jgi:clathrin heavy chain
MTNVADVLEVGEKCFEDELYQAAKLLFTSISDWARPVSMTTFDLWAFSDGELGFGNRFTLLEKTEFRLAQICGFHIIVHAVSYCALFEVTLTTYCETGGACCSHPNVWVFFHFSILLTKYKPAKCKLMFTR